MSILTFSSLGTLMNIHHKAIDSIPSQLRPLLAPADDHLCNPFSDVRVAITGGTSGLGLSLVRELLDRGAKVAFVARDRGGVERVEHGYPDSHGVVGDVSKKTDIHPIAIQVVGM